VSEGNRLVTEFFSISGHADLLVPAGAEWVSVAIEHGKPLENHIDTITRRFGEVLDPAYQWLRQRGVSHLVVLPRSWFNAVPAHALRRPNGTLWIEEFESVAYAVDAPGSRVGSVCLSKPWFVGFFPGPEVASDLPLEEEPRRFRYAAELAALEGVASGRVTRRVEAQGGVDALCEGFRQGTLVHVACHGEINIAAPLKSALQLVDGEVTLGELMEITVGRDPAPLIILSGCFGSAGVDRTRRDIVGDSYCAIDGALVRAGARGVVASIWELSDDVAERVFPTFYSELEAGHDAAEALVVAQRALVHEALPWQCLRYLSG
jgi:hypothetical protein